MSRYEYAPTSARFSQVFKKEPSAYPEALDLRFRTESGLHEGVARLATFLMYWSIDYGFDIDRRKKDFWLHGQLRGRNLLPTAFTMGIQYARVAVSWGDIAISSPIGHSSPEIVYKNIPLKPLLSNAPGIGLVPEGYAQHIGEFPKDTMINPAVAASEIFGAAEQKLTLHAAQGMLRQSISGH